MTAPALNLTALIALERAAERMAAFSFSAVEQQQGYRTALSAFARHKRVLRTALADFQANGLVRMARP